MFIPKIRLLFAAIAVILIAAPASLSATEPAAESDYLLSEELQEYWEPCFNDRPDGRNAGTGRDARA